MSEKINAGVSLKRLERLDEAMERNVNETAIPGIVSLVYRRGELLHKKSFGNQGPEPDKAMETNSIFRIYSMTKPVISVALLTLYERGKVQLFDPVSTYIPGFKNLKVFCGGISSRQRQKAGRGAYTAPELIGLEREVTVQDLLTHTSGITSPATEYGRVEDMYMEHKVGSGKPLDEYIDDLLKMPLAFQPGSRFRYGISHDVIARIIEVISGQTIDCFLKENIFEPLKMTDTGYFVPSEKLGRFTGLYGAMDPENLKSSRSWEMTEKGDFRWLSNPEKDLEYREHKIFRGGSGLVSTADDYLNFCRMLLNNGELEEERILGKKTVELMTTNHLPASILPFELNGRSFWGYGFGLGVRVLLSPAEAMISGTAGEYGWAGAGLTYFFIDPAEELIGIAMAQMMKDVFFQLPEDFRVAVYQALVE